MDKNEFKPIARKLRLAYRRDGFLDDKEALELWLVMLNDLDAKFVDAAAESYIKRNQYQPTIADIRAEYARVRSHEQKVRTECLDLYGETKGVYPCSYDTTETRAQWRYVVTKDGRQDADVARLVRNYTREFVRKHELDGTIDQVPDWLEFLRGLKR